MSIAAPRAAAMKPSVDVASSHPAESGERAVVSRLGSGHDERDLVFGRAPQAPRARCALARDSQQGVEADERFPAALAPAAAHRAVRIQGHVPDFSAVPARAEQGLAASDHAAADSDLSGDVDEVRRSGVAADAVLGDRRAVRVIASRDRCGAPVQVLAERGEDRDVVPAEVRRAAHDAMGLVHQAGYRYAKSRDDPVAAAERHGKRVQALAAHPGERPDALDRARALRVEPAPLLIDLAVRQVDDEHREVVDVDLRADGEDVPAGQRQLRAGPALAPPRGGGHARLADQAQADELGDKARHGRAGQSGARRDTGPGVGADSPEMTQYDFYIVAPDVGVACASRDGG